MDMSVMGILAFGGFAVLCLWGIGIGLKGALADAPPYMQGTGKVGRFDARLRKVA
jgi:hypothetical protein